MLRASCPDSKIRDGAKALKDSKEACELTEWKNPFFLEAYSAACAETGDFAEAVKWQKKVLDSPSYTNGSEMGNEARGRLKLYETKKPFRMPKN